MTLYRPEKHIYLHPRANAVEETLSRGIVSIPPPEVLLGQGGKNQPTKNEGVNYNYTSKGRRNAPLLCTPQNAPQSNNVPLYEPPIV